MFCCITTIWNDYKFLLVERWRNISLTSQIIVAQINLTFLVFPHHQIFFVCSFHELCQLFLLIFYFGVKFRAPSGRNYYVVFLDALRYSPLSALWGFLLIHFRFFKFVLRGLIALLFVLLVEVDFIALFKQQSVFVCLTKRKLADKAIQISEFFHVLHGHFFVLDRVHVPSSFDPTFHDQDAFLPWLFLDQPPYQLFFCSDHCHKRWMVNAVDALINDKCVFLFQVRNTKAVPEVQEVSFSIEQPLRLIFLVKQYSILWAYLCLDCHHVDFFIPCIWFWGDCLEY